MSSPHVNSNWGYGPETAKWGHDLCDFDLDLAFVEDSCSCGAISILGTLYFWHFIQSSDE